MLVNSCVSFKTANFNTSKMVQFSGSSSEIWLPIEIPFVFEGASLVSDKATIGSVFTLSRQLNELHARTERNPANAPIQPVGATKQPSLFRSWFIRKPKSKEEPVAERASLAEAARQSLAIFRKLAAKACEHRLPILLHY